jgi:hypothetical protein
MIVLNRVSQSNFTNYLIINEGNKKVTTKSKVALMLCLKNRVFKVKLLSHKKTLIIY